MFPLHFISAPKRVPKAILAGFNLLLNFYHMHESHGLLVDLHVFNFKHVCCHNA